MKLTINASSYRGPGWRPESFYDLCFMAELTPEERRMSDEKFLRHLDSSWPEKPVAPRPLALPRSLRPCILGRLCLNLSDRGPARARIRSRYCSEACRGRAEFYRLHPHAAPVARMVD